MELPSNLIPLIGWPAVVLVFIAVLQVVAVAVFVIWKVASHLAWIS